jgi:hypothetical protein
MLGGKSPKILFRSNAMKKKVFGLRGVAIFAAMVLLLAGLTVPSYADYWVTYSGDGARGPIRVGQDVDWASGDTKVVSEEVIGWYNENSGSFTVTEVTTTGAELNGLDGLGVGSVTTGLVAHAGGGQSSGTALSTGFNNVITSATAADSVKLPTAAAGDVAWVKNSGATAIDIFPYASDSIDALSVNLAVPLDPGGVARFTAISATVWESSVDASITVVAPTTAKGNLRILAANNDGDTVTTITNAPMAQASVISIPDPGAATANFVLTSAANDGAVVSSTSVELNYLDITTLGTGAASKALVLDAGDDYTWPATGILTYGVLKDSAGTTLNATAYEINMAADVSTKVEEVIAANVITSAECGRTFVLNAAAEFASTLPAIAGTGGCKFRFIVRGAPAAASYTIGTAAETTSIVGGINELEVDTSDDGPSCVAAGGCDVITFVDGVAVEGDYVELISDGTYWYLSGQTAADGGATVADTL